jgi:hypothetical protein
VIPRETISKYRPLFGANEDGAEFVQVDAMKLWQKIVLGVKRRVG